MHFFDLAFQLFVLALVLFVKERHLVFHHSFVLLLHFDELALRLDLGLHLELVLFGLFHCDSLLEFYVLLFF